MTANLSFASLNEHRRPSDLHGEELVLTFDASELLLPARREMNSGTGGKVAHRLRHQDLAWAGQRDDTGGDVNGDPRQIDAMNLTLTGVDSRAHLEAEAGNDVADGPRRLERGWGVAAAGRIVERK